MQIRIQDAVQAAAAAEERRIRAQNYRSTLLANMQLAEARAARDAADRQAELLRSEAEMSATLADPYLGEDPSMAASSLSPYRCDTQFGTTTGLVIAESVFVVMSREVAAGVGCFLLKLCVAMLIWLQPMCL